MQINTTTQNYLIDSISELEKLSSWSSLLSVGGKIELNLPGLSPEETRRYENLISYYTTACGCEQGKIFLSTLVLGYILYLYLRPQGFSGAGWAEFGIGFALACLGAVIGKIYGLITARLKLRAVIAELYRGI